MVILIGEVHGEEKEKKGRLRSIVRWNEFEAAVAYQDVDTRIPLQNFQKGEKMLCVNLSRCEPVMIAIMENRR